MKSMYVGLTTFVLYILIGRIINRIGHRYILSIFFIKLYDKNKITLFNFSVVFSFLSSIAGFTFYLVNTSMETLLLSSLYVSLQSICSTSIIAVTVNLFPTSLR